MLLPMQRGEDVRDCLEGGGALCWCSPTTKVFVVHLGLSSLVWGAFQGKDL